MIEETLLGLVRSTIAGFAAVGFGRLTAPVMRSMSVSRSMRLVLLLLCAVPIFAPTLLTGYAYARWSLPLVHHPVLKELAYLVLLTLKVVPLGALLFVLFPSVLTDSGKHCLKLAQRCSGNILPLRFRITGALFDSSGIAFFAAMLIAFHEFEVASLTGVNTWTVALFDAHAGGIPWGEAISTAAVPIAVQLLLVTVLLWGLRQRRTLATVAPAGLMKSPRSFQVRVTWLIAGFAAVAIVGLPAVLIFGEAVTGVSQLLESFALRKEIAASALFGLSAGLLAFCVSCLLSFRNLGIFAIPGLCGPLILALGAVRVLQMERLSLIYDSPVPLIAVLTLLLLPFAFLLQMLRRTALSSDSAHLAVLAKSWFPRWMVSGRINFASLLLLCLLAFSELTASAILAPPGMTTAPARLYNLMHYGQATVLSAMVMVVFMTPLVVFGLAWGGLECAVRFSRARD